jgi:hypothetical protein
MVEHDRRLGRGARQVDELAELRVVHPGIETEAERGEAGKTFAHMPVSQQPFWPADHRPPCRLVGMRGGDEPDVAKAAAAGRNHRF